MYDNVYHGPIYNGYEDRDRRRSFVYAHPVWTKLILSVIVIAVVVLAFTCKSFGEILGVLFCLGMFAAMVWAVVSIIYSVIEGLVPEYRRPRRRDR